jgi:hypothetical protein
MKTIETLFSEISELTLEGVSSVFAVSENKISHEKFVRLRWFYGKALRLFSTYQQTEMDLERGLMPLEKADEVLIPVQKDLSELLSEVQTFVDQKESPSISY